MFGCRTAPPSSSLLLPKYFWWCSTSFQRGNLSPTLPQQVTQRTNKDVELYLLTSFEYRSSATFPCVWFNFQTDPVPVIPPLPFSLCLLSLPANYKSRWRLWICVVPVAYFKITWLLGTRNSAVLCHLILHSDEKIHLTLLNWITNVRNIIVVEPKTKQLIHSL